jgi:hypothetical protein
MLVNKGMPFTSWVWRLLPVHIDILLFGFVIQLAMGIAYWILPRYRGGSRGKETVVWSAIVLLNLGIWLISCVGLFNLPGQWLAVGRLLESAAAALFASQAWGRIRSPY